METTLTINPQLAQAVCQLGHHATVTEAIQQAPDFYLKYLQQQAILTEFGQIDYLLDYDYKKQRAKL